MQILRFDPEAGRAITRFDSSGAVIAPVIRTVQPAQISCLYLDPGGVVGYHQAVVPQLLLVVEGQGWVRAEGTERIPVVPGRAVFWAGGEWHETGAESALVAVIVESEALDPAAFMPGAV